MRILKPKKLELKNDFDNRPPRSSLNHFGLKVECFESYSNFENLL